MYYNKNDIYNSSELCLSSYNKILSLDGFLFIEDKITSTQVYLVISDDVLYIVFPGTDSLRDIYTDLLIHKVYIKPYNHIGKIRIHGGFLTAYESIRYKLWEEISDILINNYNIYKIIFTGHSLGGALAQLGGLDLQYNNIYNNIECVTFGSPVIGNYKFVQSFNNRLIHYRITNRFDIIPYLIIGKHTGINIKLHGKYGHNMFNYFSNAHNL